MICGTCRLWYNLDVRGMPCRRCGVYLEPANIRSEITQMITVTPVATTKVKEIMSQQDPEPVALRVAVVGGGCSGFSYHMAFENQENPTDNVYEFDALKVLVDQMNGM